MGLMDLPLELSDNQALTDGGSTSLINSSVLNLGKASVSLGAGTPLYLNIRIAEAVTTGAGTATTTGCKFALQSCTTTGFTSGVTTNYITPVITVATMVKGAWILRMPIPYELTKQHVRCQYDTTAVTDYTTGKVDAWISPATPDTNVGA